MLKHWKTLGTEIIHRNPWWTYKKDRFEIPDQHNGEYYYAETYGSCMVVPVNRDGQLIMVNQYRYLGGRESLEFPSGGVKAEQSFLAAAHAELQEETLHEAGSMELLGEFNPCNGITKEMCQVFLATDLKPITTEVSQDITEEFEIVFHSPDEIDQMIKNQQIWDGMTFAAWLLARQRL